MLQLGRTTVCLGRTTFQKFQEYGQLKWKLTNSFWVAKSCHCYSTSQESQAKGIVAKQYPIRIYLEKEKDYAWCACGYSKKQPFCDGSHKNASFGIVPVCFKPNESRNYLLCLCKQTTKKPYCEFSCIKICLPESIRKAFKIK